jgi:hypothetical protein
MKTKTKSAVKIDLSGVDPDHVAWLRQEAEENEMTVNQLLTAQENGDIDLRPTYNQMTRGQTDEKEVEESVTVTVKTTNPKVRMAIKRQAKKNGKTVAEYLAYMFAFQLVMDDTENEVDPLTGNLIK